MADYAADCYDGAGKIELAVAIAAVSDEEAIQNACKLQCVQCELWEGPRFVAAIEDGHRSEADPSELWPRT